MITPGQSKSKAQWRFFRFCDFSSEEVRFGLTRTACHGDYEAVNRPRRAADNRRYSWNAKRSPQAGIGAIFPYKYAELLPLPSLASSQAPLTEMFTPPRTRDVRELPIPPRTRLAHGRRGLVALLTSRSRLPAPAPRRIRHGGWSGRRRVDRASATRPPRH